MANDTDADGDTLSVTSKTDGSDGTVVINGDNTVTYTPDEDFNGKVSFLKQYPLDRLSKIGFMIVSKDMYTHVGRFQTFKLLIGLS